MGLNLQKGQRINLAKSGMGDLTKVVMGLGWDPANEGAEIDLDASAILFDANKRVVSLVWFKEKKSLCGSVRHSGDNRTGDGDGDDEQITVDLSRVPANVQSIVFVITSYTGQKFNQIANAFCRMVDAGSGEEKVKYDLSDRQSVTGMIMVSVYRKDGSWSIRGIGEGANGRTVKDVIDSAVNFA